MPEKTAAVPDKPTALKQPAAPTPSRIPRNIAHIRVDAERADEEPGRIARLHRVVGYASALADRAGDEGTFDKVAGLHDAKGDLTVTWTHPPTDAEKGYFDRAWRDDRIGDGGNPAGHKVG